MINSFFSFVYQFSFIRQPFKNELSHLFNMLYYYGKLKQHQDYIAISDLLWIIQYSSNPKSLVANVCIWYLKLNGFLTWSLLMGCKGTCVRYDNIGGGKQSVYHLGYKRCSVCSLFIRFDGTRCPCCNHSLRSRRRQ